MSYLLSYWHNIYYQVAPYKLMFSGFKFQNKFYFMPCNVLVLMKESGENLVKYRNIIWNHRIDRLPISVRVLFWAIYTATIFYFTLVSFVFCFHYGELDYFGVRSGVAPEWRNRLVRANAAGHGVAAESSTGWKGTPGAGQG